MGYILVIIKEGGILYLVCIFFKYLFNNNWQIKYGLHLSYLMVGSMLYLICIEHLSNINWLIVEI